MAGKRITRAALIARVKEVRNLLLAGQTRCHILEHAEKKWKIAARQADEYIKQATSDIAEANQNSAEQNLAIITSNIWELYRAHVKKKEGGSARQCLLDLAKLRGLDKAELTLHVRRDNKDASDEALAAALANHV